ncbi:MAG TPA: hypothetical protein DHU74_02010 [Clostridiales bacterium]|nr:hypothetical protein [Clostridiales bacterium]
MPPYLVSFHEIKLGSGVFFYVDDIIEILFAVRGIKNNKLCVKRFNICNLIILLNRECKSR